MSSTNNRYPHIKTAHLIERYKAGESMRRIAISIGVHYTTVRTRLQKAGVIEKRHAWNRHPVSTDTLIALYDSGLSCDDVAKQTGLESSAIWARLKAAGHPRRRVGSHQRWGSKNPAWRGGRYTMDTGYVMVRTGEKRYEYEHRHVMSGVLGRKLKRDEHVHHLNGIRNDNRPENLAVLEARAHKREGRTLVIALQERVRELEGALHSLNSRGEVSATTSNP